MTPRQTITVAVCWVAGTGLVASVGLRLPASFLDVYQVSELVALALAGLLIAVLGALAPPAGRPGSKQRRPSTPNETVNPDSGGQFPLLRFELCDDLAVAPAHMSGDRQMSH